MFVMIEEEVIVSSQLWIILVILVLLLLRGSMILLVSLIFIKRGPRYILTQIYNAAEPKPRSHVLAKFLIP